jgi:hypothetical protein
MSTSTAHVSRSESVRRESTPCRLSTRIASMAAAVLAGVVVSMSLVSCSIFCPSEEPIQINYPSQEFTNLLESWSGFWRSSASLKATAEAYQDGATEGLLRQARRIHNTAIAKCEAALKDLEAGLVANSAERCRGALNRAATELKKLREETQDLGGKLVKRDSEALGVSASQLVKILEDPARVALMTATSLERYVSEFRRAANSPGQPIAELLGADADKAESVERVASAAQGAAAVSVPFSVTDIATGIGTIWKAYKETERIDIEARQKRRDALIRNLQDLIQKIEMPEWEDL